MRNVSLTKFKVFTFGLAFILALASLLVACTKVSPQIHTRSDVVFGGGIMLEVSAVGGGAEQAIDEIFDVAHELNDSIRLDQDSALRRFNEFTNIDTPFEIDLHIYTMVQSILSYYDILGGYFDPRIAPLSKLWNVDIDGINKYGWFSASQPDKLPDQSEIDATIAKYDLDTPFDRAVSISTSDDKYYMTKNVPSAQLDLGGIAKGYLADLGGKIAERLDLVSASFNISGDLYVYGDSPAGDPWRISVADPRPRMTLLGDRGIIAGLELSNSGLTTSGDYERFYRYQYGVKVNDEVLVQHIINPKSGTPSGLEWKEDAQRWQNNALAVSSATVIHPKAIVAEMLSTTLVAAGLDRAVEISKAILRKDGDAFGVFILEDAYNEIVNTARYAALGSFEFYNPSVYNGFMRYNEFR